MDDVIYEWTNPESGKSIVTAADMTLSQFDLTGWSHNITVKTKHSGECKAIPLHVVLITTKLKLK